MRTSGAAAGLTTFSGLASARNQSADGNLDVNVETVTVDGTRYTASIVHDSDTGEKNGFVLPVDVTSSGSSGTFKTSATDSTQLYEISNDVLGRLDESTFNNTDSVSTANSSSGSNDLWSQLSDVSNVSTESDGVSIQEEKSLLIDVVQEIAAGTKDSIDRLGAYYIESRAGSDCNAPNAYGPHHQLGGSIDYERKLGEYTESALGSGIGALLGSIGGVKGSAAGAIAGAIAGMAISDLKDSTNMTLVLRDKDKCLFGTCHSGVIDVFLSGYWMDKEYELLHVPSPAPNTPHLAMVANPDVGYHDVIHISE